MGAYTAFCSAKYRLIYALAEHTGIHREVEILVLIPLAFVRRLFLEFNMVNESIFYYKFIFLYITCGNLMFNIYQQYKLGTQRKTREVMYISL